LNSCFSQNAGNLHTRKKNGKEKGKKKRKGRKKKDQFRKKLLGALVRGGGFMVDECYMYG